MSIIISIITMVSSTITFIQTADNCELLWRTAKATYLLSQVEGSKGNLDLKKTLIYKAHEQADQALALDTSIANCHKWWAGSFSRWPWLQRPHCVLTGAWKVKSGGQCPCAAPSFQGPVSVCLQVQHWHKFVVVGYHCQTHLMCRVTSDSFQTPQHIPKLPPDLLV